MHGSRVHAGDPRSVLAMPVHMFVVESVTDSAMGGDSIRDVYPVLRMYFREHDQAGNLDDSHMGARIVPKLFGR